MRSLAGGYVVVVLLAVGALNAYPAVGVVSAARLRSLYGVTVDEPTSLLLLRHRAVLFALLGGFVLVSVFRAGWRLPAMVAALLSMVAFVALAAGQPELGAASRKVLVIDVVLSLALVPALVLQWRSSGPGA